MPEPGDWSPFSVCPAEARPPATRPPGTREGVADRLRSAAFAELQAREAFRWAAGRFLDAPAGLREEWRALAEAEERHLGWLLARLAALGVDPAARPVSARLWEALRSTRSAEEFELLIAKAEERGRQAGERFRTALAPVDPESAAVFGRIADEESAHVALARVWFPEAAGREGLA